MREGLADDIRSRGYWRFNYRPMSLDAPLPSVQRCLDVVEGANVSLRGWDFPHIPRRIGDDTGVVRLERCVEGWTDWQTHREFWRMYTSGQFLHYRVVRTDWPDHDPWATQPGQPGRPPDDRPILAVIDNVYLIAESFEFLSRLARGGLYQDGVSLSIELGNTSNRALWVDDTNRAGFGSERKTGAASLTFESVASAAEANQPKELAKKALAYFLDKFGWAPQEGILAGIINDLYELRIGTG